MSRSIASVGFGFADSFWQLVAARGVMGLGAGLAWTFGIDALSFGGTKNGAMLGEAIVVLNPEASTGLSFSRKFNMQLSSKMRFVSAQLLALLDDDRWLRLADGANRQAIHVAEVLAQALA